MRIPLAILAGIAALALPALPQATSSGTFNATVAADGAMRGGMSFPGRHFYPGTPVTGAAYSAERVTEHVQTAADGTHFTTTNRTKEYRDSQGRIRNERSVMPRSGDAPTFIEISDPVAGIGYVLDPQSKTAHRFALEAPPARQSTAAPPTTAPAAVARPRPNIKDEDLGQQVIEGVMAQGHRTTQTVPAGAQGNDRPFQVVTETWYSPELQQNVLVKGEDPRSGENTTKLTNINRTPDPSLFQPPADYSVVDETGPFQIQWTAARQ